MKQYHLAQLNIARSKHPPGDAAMADFEAALDGVHAVSDSDPDFIWRLQSDQSDSRELARYEADGWLVNMTLWKSLDALRAFIRSPLHLAVMRRRSEWFHQSGEPNYCLWWIEAGQRPGFTDALQRLNTLKRLGPTPAAFNFSQTFDAPDSQPLSRSA